MVDLIVFIAQRKKTPKYSLGCRCAWKILNKLYYLPVASLVSFVWYRPIGWLPFACRRVSFLCFVHLYLFAIFFFSLLSCVNLYHSFHLVLSTRVCACEVSVYHSIFVEINGNKFAKRFQFVPEFCTIRNFPTKRQTNIAWPKTKEE